MLVGCMSGCGTSTSTSTSSDSAAKPALYSAPYYPDQKAYNFWKWFEIHESEYRAPTVSKQSLSQMRAQLQQLNPNLTFKLGTTSDALVGITGGRFRAGIRQLAISTKVCQKEACEQAQSLVLNARFRDSIPTFHYSSCPNTMISQNWCVTLGDHAPAPNSRGWRYSNFKVDPDSIKCMVRKNDCNDEVSVVLFSDRTDNSAIDPLCLLVERMIGQFYFENVLGDIDLRNASEKPSDAMSCRKMALEFDVLTSESQKQTRDEILCDRDVSGGFVGNDKDRIGTSWLSCEFRIAPIEYEPVY